jgi:hypothetical protein
MLSAGRARSKEIYCVTACGALDIKVQCSPEQPASFIVFGVERMAAVSSSPIMFMCSMVVQLPICRPSGKRSAPAAPIAVHTPNAASINLRVIMSPPHSAGSMPDGDRKLAAQRFIGAISWSARLSQQKRHSDCHKPGPRPKDSGWTAGMGGAPARPTKFRSNVRRFLCRVRCFI